MFTGFGHKPLAGLPFFVARKPRNASDGRRPLGR
jgi:hypothetical protein